MAGKILPCTSCTCTLKASKAVRVSRRCNLVKIVLRALPITAPPRPVCCCTAATMAFNSSKLTLASTAAEPTRPKPSIRSRAETANLVSTATNLLRASVVVKELCWKALTVAVRALTALSAFTPVKRTSTRASAVRFRDSFNPKPWRANSNAPLDASSKLVAVFFAMSNS